MVPPLIDRCFLLYTIVILNIITLLPIASSEQRVVERTICATGSPFLPVTDKPAAFYECTPIEKERREQYGLPSPDVGEWNMRECVKGEMFDMARQACITKKKLRRQQSFCQIAPQSSQCPQPCTASNSNPYNGGSCNWMSAPLKANPSSPAGYMQCAPSQPGSSCGSWVAMPCAPGTQFDVRIQICVRTNVQNTCGQQAAPVCGCAQQLPQQQQCPGQCSCQQNTCCQGLPQPIPQPIPAPLPLPSPSCPGTGYPPVSYNCNQCPQQTSCQPNVGCCPQPQPYVAPPIINPPCSNGQMSISSCYTPNDCPQGTSCQGGGCCPQPQPTCPTTGVSAQISCGSSSQCPQGNGCYQGGCCPMQCPQSYQPVGFCGSQGGQSGCGGGSQCMGGCCCQQQRPTCPTTNLPASVGCGSGNQCPSGQGCYSNSAGSSGCCPMQCPQSYQPVGFCGNQGGGGGCGGGSSCMGGCCCQQQRPTCPTTSLPATIGCNTGSQCPQGQSCYNSGESSGCCPMQCPQNYQPTGSFCGNSRGGCGGGSSCMGGCCCEQQRPTCPTTSLPASVGCNTGSQCPQGQSCYNSGGSSGCCPMQCPQNYQPTGSFCGGGGGCGGGSSCMGGSCCQQQRPTCPTLGITAQYSCQGDSQCPQGQGCYQGGGGQGGCCPLACPNNYEPTGGFCGQTGSSCGGGGSCMQTGSCCQPSMPLCPTTAVSATQSCGSSSQCPQGQGCYEGGCCPMQCPQSYQPTGFCGSGGGCGGSQSCISGCCCQQQQPPSCPTGQPSLGFCSGNNQCGQGTSCQSGGCCPMPTCNSGAPPISPCGLGGGCPTGSSCQSGGCCPQPSCPSGQLSTGPCSSNYQCSGGNSCQNGGCCPQPLSTCPNQIPALQQCNGGSCPSGYGCTNKGSCCQLAYAPGCPSAQQPLCQCAQNSACPMSSTCSGGAGSTCCAAAQTQLFGGQLPGMPCNQASQCNGFSSGCSTCHESSCACTSGSQSNGVSCQQQPQNYLQQATTGCNQFGGCKLRFNKKRREPQMDDNFDNTTEPLWWKPQSELVRHCPINATEGINPDATCTPEEFCWAGVCVQKKWPGEFGCTHDEECKSRCHSAYCEKNTEQKVGQCRCKRGYVLFGLCYSKCPEGTAKDGERCRIVNRSEKFWTNPIREEKLKSNHQCGKVYFA